MKQRSSNIDLLSRQNGPNFILEDFRHAPTVDELVLNHAAVAPLRVLKEAGFLIIATTNQPGLTRGYLSRRELDLMHFLISKTFPLDDILMCPHDEWDRCPCRKPKPGLFREAAHAWQIDLEHSFVISDKWQDAKPRRTPVVPRS